MQDVVSIIEMSDGNRVEIAHFNRLLYEQGLESCRKTYTEEECLEIETFINSWITRMSSMKDQEVCHKTYSEDLCQDLQVISDKLNNSTKIGLKNHVE